ncbi:hypothetical protein F4801DRAFT_604468 [Xylaria longipes]|nr:hypothetical protein F4801DRAFT_604468 [Xylaria longipes]
MPHSNETDPATVEQEVPAILDLNIHLLCYFTAQITAKHVFNLQIYTRKWYNFLLKCLLPEIRIMIYDYMMPANSNHFDLCGTSERSRSLGPHRKFFAVPEIAHVCRDMRQYAMRRYRSIWYNYSLETSKTPRSELFSFGFFDSKKDSLEIHLRSVRAVQLVEDATLEWDNAFQAPTLTNVLSTRVKRYSLKETDKFFVFTLKESGMWQSFWEGPWVKNRKPSVLV